MVRAEMLDASRRSRDTATIVNDVHSQLNATRVANVVRPASLDGLIDAVVAARDTGGHLSVAGGRHAMGGQQFAAGATLVDASRLDRVLAFDRGAGLVDVEAGIQWPRLVRFLHDTRGRSPRSRPAPTA